METRSTLDIIHHFENIPFNVLIYSHDQNTDNREKSIILQNCALKAMSDNEMQEVIERIDENDFNATREVLISVDDKKLLQLLLKQIGYNNRFLDLYVCYVRNADLSFEAFSKKEKCFLGHTYFSNVLNHCDTVEDKLKIIKKGVRLLAKDRHYFRTDDIVVAIEKIENELSYKHKHIVDVIVSVCTNYKLKKYIKSLVYKKVLKQCALRNRFDKKYSRFALFYRGLF